MDLLKEIAMTVFEAAAGANQNRMMCERWASRVRASQHGWMRAASAASLTTAQSGALCGIKKLLLDSATFMGQFNKKGWFRRAVSHAHDAEEFADARISKTCANALPVICTTTSAAT